MQHSVTLAPELGIARLYLSKCYLRQKSPELALESYNQAVKLNSDLNDIGYWIDIQMGICEPLVNKRKYDKAITLYENAFKTLSSTPGIPVLTQYYGSRVRIALAEVYHKAGRVDKAIELYEKVITKMEQERAGFLSPEAGTIYKNLADIFREKGDEQKAVLYKQKADRQERKTNTLTSFVFAGLLTIGIGLVQFLLILASCFILWIRILILKKKGLADSSLKKMSWGFGDVMRTYVRSFLIPIGICILVFAMAIMFNLQLQESFTNSLYIIPLGIGLLSLTSYWIVSKQGFHSKLSQTGPGLGCEAVARTISLTTLTLWQLLCVGIINVIFFTIIVIAVQAFLFMSTRG